MTGKVSAAQIRAALTRRFAQPECAVVFEVAQATGYNARRHLDAVAMELWPSRGLALHGIEIKVSRHDWLREKANPAKAEEIARFCDYFWIAAPAELIPVQELPSAWGLLELRGSLLADKWAAAKTPAEPPERPFVAALLRAAARGIDPESSEAILDRRRALLDQDFENRVKSAVSIELGRRSSGAANWKELSDAIGDTPNAWLRQNEIIEAVRLVMHSGAAKTFSGMRGLSEALGKANKEVGDALRELGIEPEKPKKRARRKSGKAAP